jgi:hypothetical protein
VTLATIVGSMSLRQPRNRRSRCVVRPEWVRSTSAGASAANTRTRMKKRILWYGIGRFRECDHQRLQDLEVKVDS